MKITTGFNPMLTQPYTKLCCLVGFRPKIVLQLSNVLECLETLNPQNLEINVLIMIQSVSI